MVFLPKCNLSNLVRYGLCGALCAHTKIVPSIYGSTAPNSARGDALVRRRRGYRHAARLKGSAHDFVRQPEPPLISAWRRLSSSTSGARSPAHVHWHTAPTPTDPDFLPA